MFKKVALAAALSAAAFSPAANAGTVTGVLNVTATISGACTIVTPATLAFGNIVSTNSATTDFTGLLFVNCTATLPYSIGINNTGNAASGRTMNDGAATPHFLNYEIYTNIGRTAVWGTTIGTDTAPGTGSGSATSIPVYGRVLVQTTPPAGAYTDSLTVTVTF